jgi:NET1-associated nuclear protein 1 (U3 small nucleolar RNA-associated protein 17)
VPISVIQKKPTTAPKAGDIITNILDGPAYLIPPLETLYETLMSQFLTPYSPDDVTVHESGETREEEDVIMDVDEPRDSSFAGGARTERVIDAQEMDALIGLFRHHCVKGTRHLGELMHSLI